MSHFRKENLSPPINFAAYKTWLASPTADATQQESGSDSNTGLSQLQPSAESGTASSEPAYPTSFAHIVELITTGQPIPGIEEIPDTVLEGHDLATEKPRRRKPWEKDDGTAAPASAPADETETETTTTTTTTTGAV